MSFFNDESYYSSSAYSTSAASDEYSPNRSELKGIIQRKDVEIHKTSEMLRKAQDALKSLQKENKEHLMRLSQVNLVSDQQEIEDLTRRLRDQERLLHLRDEEISGQVQKIKEMNRRNTDLENEVERQRFQLKQSLELNTQLGSLGEQVIQQETQIERLQTHIDRLQKERDTLFEQLQEKDRLNHDETIKNHQLITQLQEETIKTQTISGKLQEESLKSQQTISQLKVQLEDLTLKSNSTIAQLTSQLKEETSKNQKFSEEIHDLTQTNQQLNSQLIVQLKDETLKNQQVTSELTLQLKEETLKNQQLHEESVKVQQIISQLTQQLKEEQQNSKQIQAQLSESQKENQKLIHENSDLKKYEDRSITLKERCEALTQKNESYSQSIQNLNTDLVRYEEFLKSLKEQISEKNNSFLDAQQKIESLNSQLQTLMDQYKASSDTVYSLEMQLRTKTVELSKSEQQVAVLQRELKDLEKEFSDNNNKVRTLELERQDLSTQVTLLQSMETSLIESAKEIQAIRSPMKDDKEAEERKRKDEALDFCFTILDVKYGKFSELKHKLKEKIIYDVQTQNVTISELRKTLKDQQQVIEQLKTSQYALDMIAELKRILKVSRTEDLIAACTRTVNHLTRYLELFPRLQLMIDEICYTLNVNRLEDAVPTVKRLMLLTKGVNQWISDNTIQKTLADQEINDVLQDSTIMEDILRMQFHPNYSDLN